MAASNAPEQNSVTTRDTLISTISTRAVLLGAYFWDFRCETHSVQRPCGLGGATDQDGELAPVLARAAVAPVLDGLFMEVHSEPANAMSDGPNQIPLEFIEDLLVKLLAFHHASR
jgi:3-deoxy-D-manno-octulosonic acid (KDO) 8-phosphate synthase